MSSIPIEWFLMLSAVLFAIGIFGAFSRRNAIAILMGIELMLNAVNINLLAFWRYVEMQGVAGLMFVIFSLTVAAAEAAVALALVIAIYRTRDTVNIEDIDLLKW
ncbi:MAG: NADH-quinone oxidoreductase subunit NuoK [Ardenticatenaceae bacterium]